MTKKISKEEWVELSKNLRRHMEGQFSPQELEAINKFIQLVGQGPEFNQVSQ